MTKIAIYAILSGGGEDMTEKKHAVLKIKEWPMDGSDFQTLKMFFKGKGVYVTCNTNKPRPMYVEVTGVTTEKIEELKFRAGFKLDIFIH